MAYQFQYKAIDPEGKTIRGVLEADSVEEANRAIIIQGNIPVSVARAEDSTSIRRKGGGGASFFSPVTPGDLIMFTKQLNTLLRSGISIAKTFDVLIDQAENPVLRKVITRIQSDVNDGTSLTDAFRKHPTVFPSIYCNLINAGELSGALSDILYRLVYVLEHEEKIKKEVKSALTYPKIVISALIGAFFILLMFVIPKFVQVFNAVKLELPLPTKICIAMHTWIQGNWILLGGGVAATIIGLKIFFKTPQGRYLRDHFVLRIPIIGNLIIKTAMARFSSLMAILLASGISIMDALRIVGETIGNEAISREFAKLREKMEEGGGIARTLLKAKYFPSMVCNMIAIGEESGLMEEILREVAKHYDEEVDHSVKGLTELIGPVLMVGLVVVVGFFALAIFLPMWDLTKMAKH